MKSTKVVVFDLDGTLLDVRECFYWQFQELSRIYNGHTLPRQRIRAEAYGATEQIVRRLVSNTSTPFEEILVTHRRLRLIAYDRHLQLHEGAEDMLIRLLSQGIIVAALTAGNYLTVSCLDRTRIRSYFQLIVTADHVSQHKPHPEGLLSIMKDLGAKPQDTVMVGDTAADIMAGKAAGTQAFGVLHGFGEACELEEAGADYLIKDLAQIPLLL